MCLNMKLSMDLRILALPVLHLLLSAFHDSDRPLTLVCLLILVLFLVASIKLPLTVFLVAQPINLRFGQDFCLSSFLAFTLLISFLFPPYIFWSAYLFCVCLSFPPLFNLLKRSLQAIPNLLVTFSTQPQEETNRYQPEAIRRDAEVSIGNGMVKEFLSGSAEFKEIIYGHA
ncbi:Nucleoid-associated protein [Actinidia chinensis var. chinensis]|uniref:Nucleoid-associated protein n=1 Tax=Actinidia chinensis var. chinensis TaxID=1590841 RepID=A0A2R6QJU0_ACTCC|nr:Nucleoid-associated protein [Actinidia chinensis var. chinensis]